MKREELRKLLNNIIDDDIPFNKEAQDRAIKTLCIPGVLQELRTLIWEADRNAKNK